MLLLLAPRPAWCTRGGKLFVAWLLERAMRLGALQTARQLTMLGVQKCRRQGLKPPLKKLFDTVRCTAMVLVT